MHMLSHCHFSQKQQEQWTISDLPMQESGGKSKCNEN